MPTMNKFFNYIDSQVLIEPSHPIFLGHRVEKKINQYGAAYFIIHLPIKGGELLQVDDLTIRIQEHHVSIFESYEEIGHHSCFHYTAQFDDVVSRAHVYFDATGSQMGLPELSYEDKPHVSADVLSSLISNAALINAMPLIRHLRGQHQAFVTALKARYEKARPQLMDSLFEHPTALVENTALLTTVLSLLEQLAAYDEKNYRKSLSLLKGYQRSLMQASIPKQMTTPELVLVAESTLDTVSSDVITPLTPVRMPYAVEFFQKTRTNDTLWTAFRSDYDKVTQLLNECELKFSDFKARVNKVLVCNQAAHALFSKAEKLMESEDLPNRTPSELEQATLVVESYLRKSEDYCVQTLQRALLSGDVLADDLKAFAPSLGSQFLRLILNNDDAASLGFVLKYGDCSANSTIVTLRDESLPLLSSTFYNNKIKCFQATLEAKGSTLLMGRDGLPLAHTLLQQPFDNPFYQALFTHSREVYQPHFYPQLVAAISVRLNDKDLDDAMRTTLLQARVKYTLNPITHLRDAEAMQVQRIQQSALPLAGHLNRDVVEELKSSPLVDLKVEMLSRSSRILLKSLQEQKLSHKALSLSNDMFSKLSGFQDSPVLSDILGNLTAEQLDKQLDNLQQITTNAIQMLEINKIIKGSASTISKKKNRGKGKFDKLLSELKALQKENEGLMSSSGSMSSHTIDLSSILDALKIMKDHLSHLNAMQAAVQAQISTDERAGFFQEPDSLDFQAYAEQDEEQTLRITNG